MKQFPVYIFFILSSTFAHAHGPQVGPGCGDLSKFMNVHCHHLNSSGCCSRWVYDHATTSFTVSGFGKHCTRAVAAQLAVNDAERKCSGTWSIIAHRTKFTGLRTPYCSVEPHDSTGFSSNGVHDQVTVYGTCTQ